MRLLTRIDKINDKKQLVVAVIILFLLILGVCLELFSPSELQSTTHCAFECTDGTRNTFVSDKCTGVDPSKGANMTFELTKMDTMNRMMELYFKGYLDPKAFSAGESALYPIVVIDASLYYKEDGEWKLWNSMVLQTQFSC